MGRDLTLFTLAWLLALFTDWYYGLFAAGYFALRQLGWIWENRNAAAYRRAITVIAIPSIVIAASLLLYFHDTSPMLQSGVDSIDMKFSAFWSMDMLFLILPAWMFPLCKISFRPWGEFLLHPGLLFFSLGLLGCLMRKSLAMKRSQSRFLVLLTVTFLLLSMGPFLQFNSHPVTIYSIPIPLPAIIMELIPTLTSIRVFARFAYIGFLGLTIIGAAWLDAQFRARVSKGWFIGITVFCSLIFLLETGWRPPVLHKYNVQKSTFRDLSGPILELPFTPSWMSGLHMYHQTFHHQPIYVSEFSRLTQYKKQYLESFPALNILNTLARGEDITPEEEEFINSQLASELRRMEISKVLVMDFSTPSEKKQKIEEAFQKLTSYLSAEEEIFLMTSSESSPKQE